MVQKVAIGIDLGTTNSCVAYVFNGHPEIIQVDNNGKSTMPSCVSFTPAEVLIGEAAKNKERTNAANTIAGVKRLMGRKFDDPVVQHEAERRAYKIVKGTRGQVNIEVDRGDKTEKLLPEQISAMILQKALSEAKAFLGADVTITGAVITIPAYFNNHQRTATMDAAKIAKLPVLSIINEPTAAALAYGLKWATEETRNVLIYDFGGGTFDVSVLEMKKGKFEVKSVKGDTHLGGDDFDRRLLEWCLEKCQAEHGVDIRGWNALALNRLKAECHKAKEQLSTVVEARIIVQKVAKGINFNTSISRAQFDEITYDLVDRTMDLVKKALRGVNPDQRKGLTVADIDHVVLVGGTTRLPLVQERLRALFKGKELNRSVNPDKAVAHGAALQAAMLQKDTSITKEILLVDVAPLGLGIEVQNGNMEILIKRNTPIPTKTTMTFTTDNDYQEEILFKVFEGDRAKTEHNVLLAEFELTGITPLPRNKTHIDVTFEVDGNGIIHVSARNTRTGKQESVVITNKGRLSKEEIEEKQRDADLNAKRDAVQRKRVEEQNKLEQLCGVVRRGVDSIDVDKAERKKVTAKCDELSEWLHANQQEAPEVYARKLDHLDKVYNNLCKRARVDNAD